MNITETDIVVESCKLHGIDFFNESMREASGPDYEKIKHLTVEEFMNTVSQNGIRICFNRNWHIDQFNPNLYLLTRSVNSIINKKQT